MASALGFTSDTCLQQAIVPYPHLTHMKLCAASKRCSFRLPYNQLGNALAIVFLKYQARRRSELSNLDSEAYLVSNNRGCLCVPARSGLGAAMEGDKGGAGEPSKFIFVELICVGKLLSAGTHHCL